MRSTEAAIFSSHAITFGKHEGTAIRDIPSNYLEWLDETNRDKFRSDLTRYLRSGHGED